MPTVDIKDVADLKVYDELQRLFSQAPEIAATLAVSATALSLRAIYANTQNYPAETIANSPQNPTGRWYERHYGPRWIRKRGDVTMITTRKRANIFEGAGLIGGSPTSEQLQLRWQIDTPQVNGSEVEGTLRNDASYALVVQGPHEGEPGFAQSGVMADIGWTSIDDGIEASGDMINAAWSDMLDEFVTVMAG